MFVVVEGAEREDGEEGGGVDREAAGTEAERFQDDQPTRRGRLAEYIEQVVEPRELRATGEARGVERRIRDRGRVEGQRGIGARGGRGRGRGDRRSRLGPRCSLLAHGRGLAGSLDGAATFGIDETRSLKRSPLSFSFSIVALNTRSIDPLPFLFPYHETL